MFESHECRDWYRDIVFINAKGGRNVSELTERSRIIVVAIGKQTAGSFHNDMYTKDARGS